MSKYSYSTFTYMDIPKRFFDLVIIDEAHHIKDDGCEFIEDDYIEDYDNVIFLEDYK